ncbi:MAG TPA: hypothetical protein VGR37_00010 [Longimicrobiaceae bacterium]|nr:hypothetical protein [Longimicrobiaceae bacterium]
MLLDTMGRGGEGDDDELALLASFARHLMLPLERIAASREEVLALPPEERLRYANGAARAAGAVPADLDLDDFRCLWSVFRANVAAARNYARPGKWGARVLLLRAEGSHSHAGVETADSWGDLTSGTVDVRMVSGDRFSLFREPHVRGRALRYCTTPPRPLGRDGKIE